MTMRTIRNYFLFTLVLLGLASCSTNKTKISLAGEWEVALDSMDVGEKESWFNKSFDQKMSLPGTTDGAGLGVPNTLKPSVEKPQILHLTRKNSYIGAAWYLRDVEIPSDWKGKKVELDLERVIWTTEIWVDGQKVDFSEESLISPHRYDLSKELTPGKHRIAIRVDNRKKYDISSGNLGHAYTNDTQIMWNGILGDISLTALDSEYIKGVKVYPNVAKKDIQVFVELENRNEPTTGNLVGTVVDKLTNKTVGEFNKEVSLAGKSQIVELNVALDPSVQLWSEFNPQLYSLTVDLATAGSKSQEEVTFGLRELTSDSTTIRVNGNPVFLRGTLECCIFPLTGTPAMDHEGWLKVFNSAKEWGLNHLRFHSWCPPKAAFEVADSLGFYLQVELPLWSLTVGEREDTNKFLYAEADRIIAEYGNHPSFCFFALGNELQPDFDFMGKLIKHVKDQDSRHLYTTTSFTFEPGHGDWPEPNDEFFVTQRTKKGWVRGQGVFDSEKPSFNHDYSEATAGMPVPLVTHEIGQYAVYPNLKEIPKYTGVLDPLNFKGVQLELEKKNRLHRADDYMMASGKLAALLYKEEIERSMKTTGCSGIQLLDLHDFPGQGTALVGLLDAFWDSKGITESTEFREFNAPITPLARYAKAVYRSNETFDAKIDVANYSDTEIKDQKIEWELVNTKGEVVAKDSWTEPLLHLGLNRLDKQLSASLTNVTSAEKLNFRVKLAGTSYKNNWNIWVYPADLTIDESKEVTITSNFNEMKTALEAGKKVLFVPDYKKLNGLEGKFVQVFWSPVHFPNQAGTMGLFCNPEHAAFTYFPTDFHTNWQWWTLLKQSKTLVMDELPEVTPIVEMVDNFAKNRRLASIFEAKVGSGKLIFSAMDLMSDWENRPEAKQLYYSLLRYMEGDQFNPSVDISIAELQTLCE